MKNKDMKSGRKDVWRGKKRKNENSLYLRLQNVSKTSVTESLVMRDLIGGGVWDRA